MKLDFVLNGRKTSLEAEPDRRVIDLLRLDLGLTGAKEGCGQGECGACTILVDGKAVLACLMLAAQLQGRELTTIEGLAKTGKTHPLQAAFSEYGAVQCGFCTPGMILSSVALLAENPAPDRQDVRLAISGNLCRCTGYVKIVDAVAAVSASLKEKEE